MKEEYIIIDDEGEVRKYKVDNEELLILYGIAIATLRIKDGKIEHMKFDENTNDIVWKKVEYYNFTVLDANDLNEFDLMRNPEIKNKLLDSFEEWKACRDKLCTNEILDCDNCHDYNKCEKRVYDKLHERR